LLEKAPFVWWAERRWGVRALAAMGKTDDALRYAEASRGRNDNPAIIARTCEEILLSVGRSAEAYERYAVESNRRTSNSVTYRSIVRKYPERERAQILRDLIAATPGEQGKWFAAAKHGGQLELAGELANQSPCDPKALTRASRDFVEKNPGFALIGRPGRAALAQRGLRLRSQRRRRIGRVLAYDDCCGAPWSARRGARACPRVGRQQGVCGAGAQQGTRARRAVAPWNAQERRRKRNQGALFTKSLLNNRSDCRSPLSVSSTDLALPTGFEMKPCS